MKMPFSDVIKTGAARCPRFDGCNAPVCPLDPDWPRAQHLPGERVCLWLREAVKPGGMARIAHAATDEIAVTVAEALPAILASSSADLRHKLAEASRSGSKLTNVHAVRGQMEQGAGIAPEPADSRAGAHVTARSGAIRKVMP